MKIKHLFLISLCSVAFLSGCSTNSICGGGSCGYYTYQSQCGLASCTDNTYLVEYSNPCPGPYDCMYQ
jgi:hypothetical protein